MGQWIAFLDVQNSFEGSGYRMHMISNNVWNFAAKDITKQLTTSTKHGLWKDTSIGGPFQQKQLQKTSTQPSPISSAF
jgi:hypothetical protein